MLQFMKSMCKTSSDVIDNSNNNHECLKMLANIYIIFPCHLLIKQLSLSQILIFYENYTNNPRIDDPCVVLATFSCNSRQNPVINLV